VSAAVNREAAEQALKVFDKYLKETTWKKEAEELKGDAKRLFQKYQNHALGRATKEEKAADKKLAEEELKEAKDTSQRAEKKLKR